MVIFVGADSLAGDGSISGGSQDDLFPARSHSISRRLSWGRRGHRTPNKKRAQYMMWKKGLGWHHTDPPSSAWRVKLKSHPSHLEAMRLSLLQNPHKVTEIGRAYQVERRGKVELPLCLHIFSFTPHHARPNLSKPVCYSANNYSEESSFSDKTACYV